MENTLSHRKLEAARIKEAASAHYLVLFHGHCGKNLSLCIKYLQGTSSFKVLYSFYARVEGSGSQETGLTVELEGKFILGGKYANTFFERTVFSSPSLNKRLDPETKKDNSH